MRPLVIISIAVLAMLAPCTEAQQLAANLTRSSANSTHSRYLIDPSRLQIVLIGSSDVERREYTEAAGKTVARMFKTLFYTGDSLHAAPRASLARRAAFRPMHASAAIAATADAALPTCEICFQSHQLVPGKTYRGAWASELWTGHDRKWW
jgi:hypothetical protein